MSKYHNIFVPQFVNMQLKFSLLLFILPFFALAKGPKPKSNAIDKTAYLKVKAEKGQGALALLRAYDLLTYPCNLDQFYALNHLERNASLEANIQYKLPIRIVKFDGKSIRTSAGLNDYASAKDIEHYNEQLFDKKLKKTSFKKDKQLWVPNHFYGCKPSDVSKPSKKVQESIADERILLPEPALIIDPNNTPASEEEEIATMEGETTEMVDENTSGNGKYVDRATYKSSLAYTKKVSSTYLEVPLFGPNYEDVPITDRSLKNQVFYIVPGHGGPDPGAVEKNVEGKYTLCEDEYAYDVCLRLARNLMMAGATVYMIVQDKNDGIRDEMYLDCDEDEVCIGGHTIPLSQKKRLRQGMQKVNKLFVKHKHDGAQKQWMISIHVDSRPSYARQDVFFYYQAESEASKTQAEKMQSIFADKYKSFQDRDYNGSVTSRPLYVMRASDAESVYIELANIKNEEDRKRIIYPKNRQLLSDWITESFLEKK